jgi:AmiR/NasT family two-component response regulator
VIGMSGGGQLSREDCLKTARRVGAAAILAKPFTRSQLIATIDLVLPERSPLPG